MKVIVLGAGIIGTASAWFLQKAGHEVIVELRQLRRILHHQDDAEIGGAGLACQAAGIGDLVTDIAMEIDTGHVAWNTDAVNPSSYRDGFRAQPRIGSRVAWYCPNQAHRVCPDGPRRAWHAHLFRRRLARSR